MASSSEAIMPPVCVAIDIDDRYKPVDVDLEKFGKNLERSFPELSQDDWDRTLIRFVDDLPENAGGYSLNLSVLRESRACRLAHRIFTKSLALFLRHPETHDFKTLNARSGGSDVLVEINLASELTGSWRHQFYKQDEEIDLEVILAHEVKHSVDHLLEGAPDDLEIAKNDKLAKRTLAHLGAIGVGTLGITGGTLDLLICTQYWNEKMAVGGSVSVLGGLVLAASPVYAAMKHHTLSGKRVGLRSVNYLYGWGEEPAEAYSIATQSDWKGVVEIPENLPLEEKT